MEKTQEKYRRNAGRWRIAFVLLVVLCVALLIAVIVLATKLNGKSGQLPFCAGNEAIIDLSEPEAPEPHHDLTRAEMTTLENYLYQQSDLNIAPREELNVSKSILFLTELFDPRKADVLAYYDRGGPKPERQARVLLLRGDKAPPVVEEYIVTLTGPSAPRHALLTSSVRKNPVPFAYRPFNAVEWVAIADLLHQIDNALGYVLKDSYGATFTDCGSKCLNFFPIPQTSAIEKKESRMIWLRAMQFVEYYTLHPLDLAFLLNIEGSDPRQYRVEKVHYANTVYASMTALAAAYNLTGTQKNRVPFPVTDDNLFSSMHRRGDPVPRRPMQAPHLVEPDGKRYNIRHRRLEYMQWEADFRLSALNGPQLFNVKLKGERIAYQIGLQEIAVFYSGANAPDRLADFVDSGALLGVHARTLIPGADCPQTATFVSASFLKEVERPMVLKRAMCIFEQNTGLPLRRHLSYMPDQGSFYGGLMDTVLIFRTVLTVANYDYIIDFIFHQSGALQVRALSTGYVVTSYFAGGSSSSPYGWHLQDNTLGNLHHHLFNFKVDLDILGTVNRYETLNISPEKVSNADWTDASSHDYWQTRFDRVLKRTEMEAAYKYNFDQPMYHIVYKEGGNTKRGVPRAFRIKMDGMSKLMLQENMENEPSISWARHQMIVTKYKDDESTSTTPYAMFDSFDPTLNFTAFYADDESIVDEDLVFWLSMGVHHIPHAEDFPITPTPGFSLDFTLLPYNYFSECPSMQSRDAIRLELRNKADPGQGVRVVREGHAEQAQCVTKTGSLEEDLEEDPSLGLLA